MVDLRALLQIDLATPAMWKTAVMEPWPGISTTKDGAEEDDAAASPVAIPPAPFAGFLFPVGKLNTEASGR